MVIAVDPTSVGTEPLTSTTKTRDTVAVRRRTIDIVLICFGALMMVILAVAGALLMWGSNFATDYVHKELSSQHVVFPDKAALEAEGRTDLVHYAGQQVTSGPQAQAYASYIAHHLDGIAAGATYADLGTPERAANAAVTAAKDSGASAADVAALQDKATTITNQRNTLFKGETLRGLLLTSYAWDTVGRVAGIAAWAAFLGAAAMAVLVVLGMIHHHRMPKA
jgi:hypothetical protein